MSNENLIQAKQEDIRSDRLSLTGNCIIAGDPKVFKTKTGKSKYSFSVMTSKWTKEQGYHDPVYIRCYMFCNDDKELETVQRELCRKAKVHIVNSVPEANKWTDDKGEHDLGVQFKVTAYYPFHLDKNLQKKEFSGQSESVEQATQSASTGSSGLF